MAVPAWVTAPHSLGNAVLAPIIAGTRLKKRWGTAGLEPSACVLPGRIAQPDPQSGISRMFDAAAARRHMVDGQIRTADVTNPDLIAAMQAVPREQFVPACTHHPGL